MEVILEIDGKKIPMNDFVKKILFGTLKGLIENLRGVHPNWKIASITLKINGQD